MVFCYELSKYAYDIVAYLEKGEHKRTPKRLDEIIEEHINIFIIKTLSALGIDSVFYIL